MRWPISCAMRRRPLRSFVQGLALRNAQRLADRVHAANQCDRQSQGSDKCDDAPIAMQIESERNTEVGQQYVESPGIPTLTAQPASAPPSASKPVSMNTCEAMRAGFAPRAVRMAISRRRRAACWPSSEAILMQTSSISRHEAPSRTGRISPITPKRIPLEMR